MKGREITIIFCLNTVEMVIKGSTSSIVVTNFSSRKTNVGRARAARTDFFPKFAWACFNKFWLISHLNIFLCHEKFFLLILRLFQPLFFKIVLFTLFDFFFNHFNFRLSCKVSLVTQGSCF